MFFYTPEEIVLKKTKILIVENNNALLSRFIGMQTDDVIIYKVPDSRVAQKVFGEIQPDCCIIDLHLPRHIAEDENYEGLALASLLNKQKLTSTRFILISRKPLERIRQVLSKSMFNKYSFGNSWLLDKLWAQREDIRAFFVNEETLS